MRKLLLRILFMLCLVFIMLPGTTQKVSASAVIAEVNGVPYDDLQLAFNNVGTGTIRLLDSVDLGSYIVTNSSNNFTLDLNGKEIRSADCAIFHDGVGTLTITDSSDTNSGKIIGEGNYGAVYLLDADLIITGGTIQNASGPGIINADGGHIYIPSGTVTIIGSSYAMSTAPTMTGYGSYQWRISSSDDFTPYTGNWAYAYTWSGYHNYVEIRPYTYVPTPLTGTVTINGTTKFGQTLTANYTLGNNTGTLSYQWKRGTENIGTNLASYNLVEADINQTITCTVTSTEQTGTIVSGPTAQVTKADGLAVAGVAAVNCASSSNNDGKLTGVTTAMEYKKSDAASDIQGTGSDITGLINGTYLVRMKETTTHNAGEYSSFPVGAYVAPVTVPGAPTVVTATAGNGLATITFNPPASNGGAAITSYTVTSNPGGFTATGASSTLIVTGLTNGTSYTFTVTATNSAGPGSPSTASNSVTPKAPQAITFNNPGAQNFGTTPTLSATSSSGLPVTFTSDTPSICTISSAGELTFLKTGTASIVARQEGNDIYLPAVAVRNFTVNAIAPGIPTVVTATAGDGQATITFSAPASNGGAMITGYTVTSSPGGFTGTGATSPITVTGLTNGTSYTFTVEATNSAGTGSASTASNSVIPKASQTITFTNPGTQNFGTTPTLSATSTSGLPVTFTSANTDVCTITSGGVLTFHKVGTATINADQEGNGSYLQAVTITRSFTVSAVAPGAPTIGTATEGNGQATVTFNAPAFNGGAAITGYTVTSSPGGFTATGASSPLTVTGLTNGTSYTFTVAATNSEGTGSASLPTNAVIPKGMPLVTTNPATNITTTTATLNGIVNANGDLATYRFEYGTTTSYGSNSEWQNIGGSGDPIPVSFELTGLMPNATYHYRVVSHNNNGTSNSADKFFSTLPVVSHLNLTGKLTAPATGGAPITTITDTQYAGSVSWSTTPSKFLGSKVYTATVTLTATSYYSFTGVNQNAFSYTGATSVTNLAGSGNTMVVTIEFPATAPRTLQSISIIHEPTKKSYYVGEVLNIAGMVVRATYNDGTYDDNFTAYTVNRTNPLTMSDSLVTVATTANSEIFTQFDLTISQPTQPISGTVTISGGNQFNQTLTASYTPNDGDNGTVSYQWKRDGSNIGTNSSTYTLVEADIEHTITCEVRSLFRAGSITSNPGVTIAKTDGQAVTGVAVVNCTNSSNNDGKLTGITIDMEYKKSDAADYTSGTGSDIAGLVSGTYQVRRKATNIHNAGAVSTFTVGAYVLDALTGSVTINGTTTFGQTLTATYGSGNNTGTISYQWKRGSENIGTNSNTYTLVEADVSQTITCEVRSTEQAGFVVSGATSAITKAENPAVTGVAAVNCTHTGNNDGKLTGVTTAMEYKKIGDTSYIVCNAGSITNLTSGTYLVRFAATSTHNAGADSTLSVGAYVPPTPGNSNSGTTAPQKTEGKIDKDQKQDEKAPNANLNDSTQDLKSKIFSEEEQTQVAAGKDAKVILKIEDISATVSAEEKKQIEEKLAADQQNATNVGFLYVDISLFKQIGDEAETRVTKTNGMIKISIEVPENLWSTENGLNRTYRVVRMHNGVAEVLEGTYDPTSHLFTFETDQFSTYALTYQDENTVTPEPAPIVKDFNHLCLTAKAYKTSQKLSYVKEHSADGYIIYGGKCGEEMVKLADVSSDTTSYTVKKLKQRTYYKYQVKAYKLVDGKQVIIVTSKVVHSITESKKYADPTKVTAKTTSITLEVGKSQAVDCQVILPADKKLKQHTAAIRYEVSDKAIATINSKGKITAKAKGTCYVYAYAQNGVYQKIKVTVE